MSLSVQHQADVVQHGTGAENRPEVLPARANTLGMLQVGVIPAFTREMGMAYYYNTSAADRSAFTLLQKSVAASGDDIIAAGAGFSYYVAFVSANTFTTSIDDVIIIGDGTLDKVIAPLHLQSSSCVWINPAVPIGDNKAVFVRTNTATPTALAIMVGLFRTRTQLTNWP